MDYNFEWDPVKAEINRKKHRVTFEQACAVFNDPMAITVFDEDNSVDVEDRWITLGQTNSQLFLVVVHTYRELRKNNLTIRLISARLATKHEIKQYEG
ncbi:MAG: BrnT family toxin [Nitrincola sp.]|nr:BrnT family toxin [Nitrincola sp.]